MFRDDLDSVSEIYPHQACIRISTETTLPHMMSPREILDCFRTQTHCWTDISFSVLGCTAANFSSAPCYCNIHARRNRSAMLCPNF